MTLHDFELTSGKHFIAMEYYFLIMNRTFLILLSDEGLIGVQANGLISAEGGGDQLTRAVTQKMSVSGDLNDARSYVKQSYLAKIKDVDLLSSGFLNVNKFNFRIAYSDIAEVTYDSRKKWGMGYYPHDGKVFVRFRNGKRREFIILGEQSGIAIRDWIKGKIA